MLLVSDKAGTSSFALPERPSDAYYHNGFPAANNLLKNRHHCSRMRILLSKAVFAASGWPGAPV
jgi:hypothetical protein